jgi:hypothetical protein
MQAEKIQASVAKIVPLGRLIRFTLLSTLPELQSRVSPEVTASKYWRSPRARLRKGWRPVASACSSQVLNVQFGAASQQVLEPERCILIQAVRIASDQASGLADRQLVDDRGGGLPAGAQGLQVAADAAFAAAVALLACPLPSKLAAATATVACRRPALRLLTASGRFWRGWLPACP